MNGANATVFFLFYSLNPGLNIVHTEVRILRSRIKREFIKEKRNWAAIGCHEV
jgi:hypothetical protein